MGCVCVGYLGVGVCVCVGYLGVGLSADDEADRSWSTLTQDGVGLAQRSVTQALRVHLQDLVSTATDTHTQAYHTHTSKIISSGTCL